MVAATTAAVDGRREAAGKRTSGRHPGDAIRVGLGIGVLAVALLAVRRDSLTTFEHDLFRLVNDLPQWMRPELLIVMQAGNVVAAFVFAALALARRARRLAFDLVVAGPVAWIVAKEVKDLVGRPRPGGLLADVARYGPSEGLGFVSGHTAVAAALATAAAPYLPRRWRRAAWAGTWLVGMARIYEGAHLPLDVVGGAALGWAIGATVHVALGAPHRAPSLDDARKVLVAAGVAVRGLRPVGGDPQGSFPFIAEVDDRETFVKLLDPEERDRDRLYRLARFFAFRDVRVEAGLRDELAQAEHEAAVTLMARSAGVRCPAIERVQRLGSQVWLMEEVVGSESLATFDRDLITDAHLFDAWEQVRRLHAAGIAHRDLVADNVVIDGHGRAALVDFAHAVSGPSSQAKDNDVAELLVSTSQLVGVPRALEAAAHVMGRDRIALAASEIQPFALTAVTRRRLRGSAVLADLRRELAGPQEPVRHHRSVFTVAAWPLTLGVLLAIGGGSAVLSALTSGSARWMGVVLLAGTSLYLHRAAGIVALSRRPLALGRMAVSAAIGEAWSLVGRGERERAVVARAELQRAGLRPAAAGRASDEWRTVRLAALGVLATVAAVVTALGGSDVTLTTDALGLVALATTLVAASSMWGWPPVVWPRLDRILAVAAGSGLAEALTSALTLAAAVESLGGNASVASVVLVAAAVDAASRAASAPSSAADLLATAGLISAGLAAPTAVAAVLLWRGATSWLFAAAGVAIAPLHRARGS